MANVDTIDITKLILVEQGSTPSSPSAGKQKLFVRSSDHLLCIVDSAGTVTPYGGALVNPMTTAGDIIIGGASGTPARLALAASGKVPTGSGSSVAAAYPPGYEFTYDEFTSPVNITATSEGTADTVKACSAVTYDGSTAVYVEFWCPYAQSPAGQNVVFVLLEDSTVLGLFGITTTDGVANPQRVPGVMLRRRRTPSNASHTYTVKAYVSGGTGVIGVGAGGSATYLPGYVRVVKA